MSFFGKGKAQESQSLEDPHGWELPCHWTSMVIAGRKQTVIPEPQVFRNLWIAPSSQRINDETLDVLEYDLHYPDISHVAVHLCMLECFRKLRHDATYLDEPQPTDPAPPYSDDAKSWIVESEVEEYTTEHERKWNVFVELAVTRFNVWWNKIEQVLRHASAYTNHTGNKANTELSKDYLPPLDVLLVWYSYMLSPVAYEGDCKTRDIPWLLHLRFPWSAIADVIDREKLSYNLPTTASKLFTTISRQSADILTYLAAPPAYTESIRLPFSVDLIKQVKNQRAFIEEAHHDLWLRSPALVGSTQRSIRRYKQFVSLIHFQPGCDVIPPKDVELIWRTHQLFPEDYRSFCNQLFEGELRRHGGDLEIVKKDPETRLEEISALWSAQFNEPFDPCLCWTCERVRDHLPEGTPLYEPFADSSIHLPRNQIAFIKEDVGFHLAVEKARLAGKPLPARQVTKQEKEKLKEEEKKRDAVGVLPGIGYHYEVVPAKYDKNGKLVREEKRVIKRDKANRTLIRGFWFAF